MKIEYNHSQNSHTVTGPRAALPLIFQDAWPRSVLDVGCGTGTWLKTLIDFGVDDVFGVDGVAVPAEQLLVAGNLFRRLDLTQTWNLERRFHAVLCLEVAEHLDQAAAPVLIETLTNHSERIVFSAACPGQTGQHHVNCQWPGYWQKLFNERGFVCSDDVRWKIWDSNAIEPWYRQNIFIAHHDPSMAGREPRIRSVFHPEMVRVLMQQAGSAEFPRHVKQIEGGVMHLGWYCGIPFRAAAGKLRRRIGNG
jgi:SAM-dependent methyltransferase